MRLSNAEARAMGLIPTPKRGRGSKTHTAAGHLIVPEYTGYSEAEFQVEVMKLAREGGWTCGQKDTEDLAGLVYHPAHVLSQSEKGWPDLTMARRRDRRLIFAELKSETNDPTPRQAAILDLLRCLETPDPAKGLVAPENIELAHQRRPLVQVFVWRPSDLPAIAQVLA
jgi:hypothetical protein